MTYDVVVVGAGIVGLSTAYNLAGRRPDVSIAVLEKESEIARHQSSHNSGVIHSGIYYAPGSLKARNCREGKQALVEFCEREGVAYEMCGKVIVAVNEEERAGLRRIYERGVENQIECEIIGAEELQRLEPHAAGVEAIHVPRAGIADYHGLAVRIAELLGGLGHDILTSAEVLQIHRDRQAIRLETRRGAVTAGHVVTCAGLYADRVARMSGQDPEMQIVPFRGEYFELKPEVRHLCRNLIYPVPNPDLPFLGVHVTRLYDGRVECGPNAVLAFAREGYRFGTVDVRDLTETLTYPGFRKLALRHWKTEAYEIWRSLSERTFLKALKRLIPALTLDDVTRTRAGVRAQAVLPDGRLADDFVIREADRILHVCNAPSPAATASLKVGEEIVDRLLQRM